MRQQPPTCHSCPYDQLGRGFAEPTLGTNGVMLLTGALGADDLHTGAPLQGQSGQLLGTLLARGGLNRADFTIAPTLWCQPPPETPLDPRAVQHCTQHHTRPFIESRPTDTVLVPLGELAVNVLLGSGVGSALHDLRGYADQDTTLQRVILPTYNPGWILRGNGNYGGVLVHDVQKALDIVRDGFQEPVEHFLIDPSPAEALDWARAQDPQADWAFDIETPGKNEDESKDDAGVKQIDRIGFSSGEGHTLSVPWAPEYFPAIQHLLAFPGDKIVWNRGFDVPRVREHGMVIHGTIHDGMLMWHVLNSDLPKKLGFAATFLVPHQRRWKHLGSQSPRYNAIDAHVEWCAVQTCKRLLHESGLWQVYQEQVCDVNRVLDYMTVQGVPTNTTRREASAQLLSDKIAVCGARIQEVVPADLQPVVWKARKTALTTHTRTIDDPKGTHVCSACGKNPATKIHAKVCGHADTCVRTVVQYGQQKLFNPSSWQQIQAYMRYRGHPLVMAGTRHHKKATTDVKAMKTLMGKFPDDPLYPLLMEWRVLNKLAGTYIGRFV